VFEPGLAEERVARAHRGSERFKPSLSFDSIVFGHSPLQ
jgi:hypothetical protein